MRKLVAASVIAVAASASLVFGLSGAHATTHPTLSTTSRTEVLISPKCYQEHQVTKTWFHYSTKTGGYVAYVAPKTTTTDSTYCHA
jgi:hypothetical protein